MSLGRKILFVSPQPFFEERGSPYRVRATLRALVDAGYDVDLLTYPIGRDLKLKGVHHRRSPNFPGIKSIPIGFSWGKVLLDSALFGSLVLLLLKKNEYRLIHAVEESALMSAFLSLFFRRAFIFDMHSHLSEQLALSGVLKPQGLLHRTFCWLELRAQQKAAGIVTVSEGHEQVMKELAPFVPSISLPDLPLDISKEVRNEDILQLRKSLQAEDKTMFVYTGNFESYQGIGLLLDSYRAFLDQLSPSEHDRYLLVVVGSGTEKQLCAARLQVADLLDSGLIVFTGAKTEKDAATYSRAADVLVSPRLWGGHTPLKLYSYMLAGRPIVATRIPAHLNVLTDDCALLADANPASLSVALFKAAQLKKDSPETGRLVENALHAVNSYTNPQKFQEKLSELYRCALGETRDDLEEQKRS